MKKKSNIYNFVLTIIAFLIPVIFYSKLPYAIPCQFSMSTGGITNYMNKPMGAFLLPLIMALIWIGMLYLPKIDPRRSHYAKFAKSYGLILCLILTFFFVLQIVIILVALGFSVPVNTIIPFAAGVLIIVIGNYMPKSKSNFFYGIKTPWTLSSEISWKKTHKLGGILFVLSGILICLSSLFLNGSITSIIVLISIILSVVIIFIASYFFAKNAPDLK